MLPLNAHKIQVKKIKTLFIATKFDNTRELKSRQKEHSISIPMLQLSSQSSISATEPITRQMQANNIFSDSKNVDKQQYKEWHYGTNMANKDYVLRSSIVGNLQLMTNYLKKMTTEANRNHKLCGLLPSTRRNALNKFMSPSRAQLNDNTSSSNGETASPRQHTNVISPTPCGSASKRVNLLSQLDPRLKKKNKRNKFTHESQTKEEILEKIETIYSNLKVNKQDQLQDRFYTQMNEWEEVNELITEATSRQPRETLFSRLGEWRSHVEDKQKIESMKGDIDFLGDKYFNKEIMYNLTYDKIVLSQDKPQFNLNLTHHQSIPEMKQKARLSNVGASRCILPLKVDRATDDCQNGYYYKKFSKSKQLVEIIRCPQLNRDLSTQNIRCQLYLNRKPNLTQQNLMDVTTVQWAKPDKYIDTLQINGQNVLKKEWQSLRDDQNDNQTLFSIIKNDEKLEHLNESIDVGYV